MQPSTFRTYLERVRKPDLSPQERARIRAELPKDGEVKLSDKSAQKLLAIQPILEYHRRGGLIEAKVVEAFQAWIGLHARSFILITEPAFRLLDSEEIQALAAHELGHDYFWDEYQQARDTHDDQRAQELELRCDAIAVFTLADLGLNPGKLLSATNKPAEFNAQFGTPLNVQLYVPHRERLRFIEAVIGVACSVGGRCGKGDHGGGGGATGPQRVGLYTVSEAPLYRR
jgi:hypothetical protein